MTSPRPTDRERVALLCHRLARELEHRATPPTAWVQHPNRRLFRLAFLAPPQRVWVEDAEEWD